MAYDIDYQESDTFKYMTQEQSNKEMFMLDTMQIDPTASTKNTRKSKKRKWREIEAIKEANRLKKELRHYDYDFDVTED